MKEAKTQENATKVATNDVDHELDHPESGYSENGHEPEETVVSEGTNDLHDEARNHVDEVPALGAQEVVEEVAESIVEILPDAEGTHAEVHVDAMVMDDAPPDSEPEVHLEALVVEPLSHGDVNSNGSVESQELAPATEETVHSAMSEVPAVEDDIEDMVVMLESVSLSKYRPQSIVSIPDEHGEIPDEDQS
jgi:hypothetical protein